MFKHNAFFPVMDREYMLKARVQHFCGWKFWHWFMLCLPMSKTCFGKWMKEKSFGVHSDLQKHNFQWKFFLFIRNFTKLLILMKYINFHLMPWKLKPIFTGKILLTLCNSKHFVMKRTLGKELTITLSINQFKEFWFF